jgi:hypothetical protein
VFVYGETFQPTLMFVSKSSLEWSAWKVPYSGKLRPYSQTSDKAGKAYQVQTL